MLKEHWRDQDEPVSDELLAQALRHMKRTAAYGGMSPVLVLGVSVSGREDITMLALALELARARGLDALASEDATEGDRA